MIDKPTWKHDCKKCEFLGSTIGGGRLVDCYVCGESLVARYGNGGPKYYSGLIGYANPNGHAELFVAAWLAAQRGKPKGGDPYA